MIDLAALYERYGERLKASLSRLAVNTFAVYVLLYLIQLAGLFHVESVLQLDFVWTVAVVSSALSLVLYANADELPERSEKTIQYAFVFSLVALVSTAYPTPLTSGINEFFESRSANLVDVATVTGIVSFVSVRANEVRTTFLSDRYPKSLRQRGSYRMYAVGLCVLAVLGYFLSIRWPFIAKPFGGVAHSDKYGLHVPYLQGMYRAGNPFYMTNPTGVSMYRENAHVIEGFWYIPIFEWATLPLLLASDLEIELLVRSTATIQGAVLLVVLFLFLRELFDEIISLFGILLFAVNRIFNLVSYLTVMDLPALVFTFLGFVLYWREEKTYAYLACGLAALTKYSFLLIAVFPIWIFILTNERDKLYNSLKLGYCTFVPILLFRFLVSPAAGGSPANGALRVLCFAILLALSALAFERYERPFVDAVAKIDRQVRHVSLVAAPLFGIVLLQDEIREYTSEFMTDRYLLFNANVYSEMLEQIRYLQPDAVFYFFPLGAFWLLLTGDRKRRSIVAALVCTAVAYGVIASKSVFIHTYYKHIFGFVCLVGFLGIIDALRRFDVSPAVTVPACVVVVLSLALASQAATVSTLDQQADGTREMAAHIDGHVPESELILYGSATNRLMGIYSDAKFTSDWTLTERNRERLKRQIRSKGFGPALRDRNVTHYLSYGPSEFEELKYLKSEEDAELHVRRNYILSKVEPDYSPTSQFDDVSAPDEFFVLETKIGNWHLYEITASPTDSASNSETRTATISGGDSQRAIREPSQPSVEAAPTRTSSRTTAHPRISTIELLPRHQL